MHKYTLTINNCYIRIIGKAHYGYSTSVIPIIPSLDVLKGHYLRV